MSARETGHAAVKQVQNVQQPPVGEASATVAPRSSVTTAHLNAVKADGP